MYPCKTRLDDETGVRHPRDTKFSGIGAEMAEPASLDASLAKSAPRVCGHMNDDHSDSVLAYAMHYAGLADAVSARMVGLTSQGFVLDVTLRDGTVKSAVSVPYIKPLENAGQVRKMAVAMHIAAYNGLGMRFKLKHGFYQGAAKQAWAHMPDAVKTGMTLAGAASAALIVALLVKKIR